MRHQLPFRSGLVVVSFGLLVSGCGDDGTSTTGDDDTSGTGTSGSASSSAGSSGVGSSGSGSTGSGSSGASTGSSGEDPVLCCSAAGCDESPTSAECAESGGEEVDSCDECPAACDVDLTTANEMNELLGGVLDLVAGLMCGTFPTVLVHSTGDWTSPGAGDHTEIAAVYHGTVDLDQATVDELTDPETGALACGFDNYGRVACDDEPQDMNPGTYHVLLTNYLGILPQSFAEDRNYQYGFVFDQDANPANNYVPSATYPEDFFRGTDRWYDVSKAPEADWTLQVTDATDNEFVDFPSGARALIRGNAILLVIPAPEFVDDSPDFRTTAFGHYGDYGFDPPHVFSGDIEPPLDLPLLPW